MYELDEENDDNDDNLYNYDNLYNDDNLYIILRSYLDCN